MTYYDGKKVTYLNLERVKGIKKYHYYKWDFPKLADDLEGMNVLKLDVIVVTVGEQTGTEQQEILMDWRYQMMNRY